MKSLTTELVEIMTGVTPPKEWKALQYPDDTGSTVMVTSAKKLTEADAKFIVRATQNFEPLVDALMDIEAAGRPHGTDRLGNACECPQCEAWDSAKAALNNALKP